MLRRASKTVILLCALAVAPVVFAQTDRHVTEDPAKFLYYQSAFAHGYRHGYDQGFHIGDQDLQMGRKARPCDKMSEYKKVNDYHHSYGDKSAFQKGFRQGFSHGYEDAYSGRDFQVVNEARAASVGINGTVANDEHQRRVFDEGFTAGYQVASSVPQRDFFFDPSNVMQLCEQNSSPNRDQRDVYCRGYTGGFVFGITGNGAVSDVVARNNGSSR